MTRVLFIAVLLVVTGCRASFFHGNGVCEIRVDGSSALSTLDSVEVAIDTALSTAKSTSMLLVIQVTQRRPERIAALLLD